MPPRSRPAPERPPVDSWTIMPGQCFSIPSFSRANFFRIGGRRLISITHMAVRNRSTRLERLKSRLDLFLHRDRHGGVVILGRQRPGDRDADDAGFVGHLFLFFQAVARFNLRRWKSTYLLQTGR